MNTCKMSRIIAWHVSSIQEMLAVIYYIIGVQKLRYLNADLYTFCLFKRGQFISLENHRDLFLANYYRNLDL